MRYGRVRFQDRLWWAELGPQRWRLLRQAPYAGLQYAGVDVEPAEVTLSSPCAPSKIVGVGLNYRSHRQDGSGPDALLAQVVTQALDPAAAEPLFFLKAPSAVVGPGESIVLPPDAGRVDFEAELAVVIGRPVFRPDVPQAAAAIFGYTGANDVTARDWQARERQWFRAKSFDTFCPLGPWIETELEPDSVLVEGLLDGELRQRARTDELIVGVVELVQRAAQVLTLLPGDVLLTGTPGGSGPLAAGQVFTVRVQGIGELSNPVVGG